MTMTISLLPEARLVLDLVLLLLIYFAAWWKESCVLYGQKGQNAVAFCRVYRKRCGDYYSIFNYFVLISVSHLPSFVVLANSGTQTLRLLSITFRDCPRLTSHKVRWEIPVMTPPDLSCVLNVFGRTSRYYPFQILLFPDIIISRYYSIAALPIVSRAFSSLHDRFYYYLN